MCGGFFLFIGDLTILVMQKLGDIMEMTFGGRYVILMMSLFSIFTGLIYNEFFSVPFGLFGQSAYTCRDPSCRYIHDLVPHLVCPIVIL